VSDLTLMAVHAHPDDEVIATGGVLAKAADQGIRTVVVTCTNGEEGDGPGGIKPDDPAHDAASVATLRLKELQESCSILGVARVELLGYRDSGMDGWVGNQHADAFANVPVEVAAARLVELMKQYRPQVVIAYDENGGYGHPDHIQAHRVAVAAAEASDIPEKLYYSAFPRSAFARFRQRLQEAGLDPVELGFDPPPDQPAEVEESTFGVPDEMIDTTVDVTAYADRKRRALMAHGSQTDNSFFNRLPAKGFEVAFGQETFIRVRSRPVVSGHEDDLFNGLR
jgi:LmbE family N-acetylglucosaminyl deacetylase